MDEYLDAYLMHYGVKGMKWGVRNEEPPSGRRRTSKEKTSIGRQYASYMQTTRHKVKKYKNVYYSNLGKNSVDTYIEAGVELSRIQSTKEFNTGFAYYATYKSHDVNEYAGLFGKNLMSRADAAARAAEKQAKKDLGNTELQETAKKLRSDADNMQIYQLKLSNTKKLKVPSEENAAKVLTGLLKDEKFKDDLKKSLEDSASKMKRPTQQMLFKEADKALRKDISRMSSQDKISLYKAANLTLTNHNDYEVSMQNTFYKALKKQGYSALVDTNDQEFSSYHAKRPMIVFDTSSTKLQSVSTMNPNRIEKLYKVYNTERIIKEIPTNAFKVPRTYSSYKISHINEYIDRKYSNYMR